MVSLFNFLEKIEFLKNEKKGREIKNNFSRGIKLFLEKNMGYIYIRTHPSYNDYSVVKLGKTKDIGKRDATYATGELIRGKYISVYKIIEEDISDVETFLERVFSKYNVYVDGGTEFYDAIIVSQIEDVFERTGIKYGILSTEEIEKCIRVWNELFLLKSSQEKEKGIDKIDVWMNVYDSSFLKKTEECKSPMNEFYFDRSYQSSIIHSASSMLTKGGRVYVDLPTGAGKTYIAYRLMGILKERWNIAIIFSPRKIVNSQNISIKYKKMMGDCDVFNFSKESKISLSRSSKKKKIIVCCTQSVDKLYEAIFSSFSEKDKDPPMHKDPRIFVWFDEAHWGVEEWTATTIPKLFFLENDTYIKYRLFTSASPNTDIILAKPDIFGEYLKLVTMKELIKEGWLANIKPFVYSESADDVDPLEYILSQFSQKKRSFGFSFHNKQKNAMKLFQKHLHKYDRGLTTIKPFLLITEDLEDEVSQKIPYNYRDISLFEKEKESLGYVVAKYSMGYDFKDIDFICISDPKLSSKDIKQTIGRGLRPDALGKEGRNIHKELMLLLPVWVEEEETKYDRVIEVLRYLLYDIEIDLSDISFGKRLSDNRPKGDMMENYEGEENIGAILLDLLRRKETLSYSQTKKLLKEKKIMNKEEYAELAKKDIRFPLDPEEFFGSTFLGWVDYLSMDVNRYYNIVDCKKKIEEYLKLNPSLLKNIEYDKIYFELCQMDKKFPPYGLWMEFYKIGRIEDIIKRPRGKKKIFIK